MDKENIMTVQNIDETQYVNKTQNSYASQIVDEAQDVDAEQNAGESQNIKTTKKNEEIISQIRFDANGLVPAIVQDYETKQVLMLAYMNEEAVRRTLSSGKTWFYSRSRQSMWNKGETSGHFQNVKKISYDCDADTILVIAEQIGAACHTGNFSCFYRDFDILK